MPPWHLSPRSHGSVSNSQFAIMPDQAEALLQGIAMMLLPRFIGLRCHSHFGSIYLDISAGIQRPPF